MSPKRQVRLLAMGEDDVRVRPGVII